MKPVLFADVDGLIAQLASGALALHGKHLDPLEIRWGFPTQIGFTGVDDAAFWAPMDRAWWANLERHEDGFEVLKWAHGAFGADNVIFLTSPSNNDGCVDGKIDWLEKHVGKGTRRRTFVGPAKHTVAGPTKVLLDDHEPHCDRFRLHGGRAVLAPRPWNSRITECGPDGSFSPEKIIAELERHLTEITTRGPCRCLDGTSA